jgi:hypothetical protein
MTPGSDIWETDRPTVEVLISDWKRKHRSKGTKILVPVVRSVNKGFFKSRSGNSKGKAWDIWKRALTKYPSQTVEKRTKVEAHFDGTITCDSHS